MQRIFAYTEARPRLRRIVGWFLVVVGFLALVTPLTPGGLLFFVGLEMLGLRLVFIERMKQFLPQKKTRDLPPSAHYLRE